ncbi:MAG: hypothetical protein AB2A00_16885 [Myxococcota bacterium]
MNRKLSAVWKTLGGISFAVLMAAPAYAGGGNGAPSGPHYNLNIIGMEKGKTARMTGSDRHTIFVGLGSRTGAVSTPIYLTQGDFKVCDGNGFDTAYDCSGRALGGKRGAVFQLPCNTNISSDGVDEVVACDGGETAAYEVWARALGTPGGGATMTTCATDTLGTESTDDDVQVCSTENTVLVRSSGRQTFNNVTDDLTSLVACETDDVTGEVVCTRTALFSGDLVDWYWQYDNNGLRLAQLRFNLL